MPEPVSGLPLPDGPVSGNLDPVLEHVWHPVARVGELLDGGWVSVRLLGRTWTVHREGGRLRTEPAARAVEERYGVLWLAPAEPCDVRLEVPEHGDPRVTVAWLPPERTSAPAGPLAEALLYGACRTPAPEVQTQPGGFTAVQEPWPGDPGGPRRRATHVVRAPFQLLRRLEELDTGAVRTVLFLLQPEDADSTRVHTCLLLRGADGTRRVPADAVAGELATARAGLAEDLARAEAVAGTGPPLPGRDERHVRADRLGVALRRSLTDLAVAARETGRGAGRDDAAA